MWRYLRPAGERIRLQRGPVSEAAAALGEPETAVRFYDSGTAALASAIKASAAVHPVEHPEVLMPAYACPDLVSAAVFAGVRPVLVDFVPERPWMDLDALRRQITANTVAVVAVNFLGIPERVHALAEIARERKVSLLYDCAQSLEAGVATGEAPLRILSFGRGKPVSLLGGGAVLCSDDLLLSHMTEPAEFDAGDNRMQEARFAASVLAYNSLSEPGIYKLPASLPFLKLGETRFKALPRIGALPRFKRAYLVANMASQSAEHEAPSERIRTGLASCDVASLTDLPTACGATGAERLLRYPLLMPNARSRAIALEHLRSYGAIDMYRWSLPQVPGIGDRVAPTEYPHADDFAQRLITLPVHADVRAADSEYMVRAVRTAAQRAWADA